MGVGWVLEHGVWIQQPVKNIGVARNSTLKAKMRGSAGCWNTVGEFSKAKIWGLAGCWNTVGEFSKAKI